jgi:hypothetical protein
LETALSFVAALMGAFVGAWASVRTVVDASRIRWIDTLREDVSELLVVAADVRSKRLKEQTLDAEKSNRLRQLDFKIRLMLNPNEEDHIKLHDDVNRYVQMTLDQSISDGEYYNSRENVFCSSRTLLKKEWNRVSKFWLRRLFRRR